MLILIAMIPNFQQMSTPYRHPAGAETAQQGWGALDEVIGRHLSGAYAVKRVRGHLSLRFEVTH